MLGDHPFIAGDEPAVDHSPVEVPHRSQGSVPHADVIHGVDYNADKGLPDDNARRRYYNDHAELKSELREIYELIRGDVLYGVNRLHKPLSAAILDALEVVPKWQTLQRFLTQPNQNMILKGLVTSFQGLGL